MNSIPNSYQGETVVIVATGPSLNKEQIDFINAARHYNHCRIMTVNNSYQLFNYVDIHVACNDNWWEHYWWEDKKLQEIRDYGGDLWTRYEYLAEEYKINFIDSIVKDGLSRDAEVVHINHGSGPMAINIAYLYGFRKMILVGHDMKFAKDYNGKKKKVGSTPRHYFGEYPSHIQHFPRSSESVDIDGNIIGLIAAYKKMIPDLEKSGIDIVNCTPNSSLTCFRNSILSKEL